MFSTYEVGEGAGVEHQMLQVLYKFLCYSQAIMRYFLCLLTYVVGEVGEPFLLMLKDIKVSSLREIE